MTNPFEDQDGTYLALINHEGQYSLWPQTIDVPLGWTIAFGPDKRQTCLDYVEKHWTDMRPRSLIASLEKAAAKS